jgi:hypothetical protein
LTPEGSASSELGRRYEREQRFGNLQPGSHGGVSQQLNEPSDLRDIVVMVGVVGMAAAGQGFNLSV